MYVYFCVVVCLDLCVFVCEYVCMYVFTFVLLCFMRYSTSWRLAEREWLLVVDWEEERGVDGGEQK